LEESDAPKEKEVDPNENLDFINEGEFSIEDIKANIQIARQNLN
jgi:hypothetical protein